MARLVRLERAGAISQERWNAIVDQSRALDVGSPCIESVGHLLADKRHRPIAHLKRLGVHADLIRAELHRGDGGGNAKERQRSIACPDERWHPSRNSVAVERLEILPQSSSGVCQCLKRRDDARAFFDK